MYFFSTRGAPVVPSNSFMGDSVKGRGGAGSGGTNSPKSAYKPGSPAASIREKLGSLRYGPSVSSMNGTAPNTPINALGLARGKPSYGDTRKWASPFLRTRWAMKIDAYLEKSAVIQLSLAFLLFVSLYLPDAWVLANVPNSADSILDAILIIVFIGFSMELSLLSLASPGYFNSFFFWMDMLGTISVLFDTSQVSAAIFSNSESSTSGSLLRAARAAKVGVRSGRLAKLTRLARYTNVTGFKKEKDDDGVTIASAPYAVAKTESQSYKMINKSISRILSTRVAILVLVLVITIPMLDYQASDNSPDAWLSSFDLLIEDEYITTTTTSLSSGSGNGGLLEQFVDEFEYFYTDKNIKPISLDMTGSTGITSATSGGGGGGSFSHSWTWDGVYDTVRDGNIVKYSSVYSAADFDFTKVRKAQSTFSMIIVTMVMLLLIAFAISCNASVDKNVSQPLERMLNTIRQCVISIARSVKAHDVLKGQGEGPEGSEGEKGEDAEGRDLELILQRGQLEVAIERLALFVQHRMEGDIVANAKLQELDDSTKEWIGSNFMHGAKSISKNTSIRLSNPSKGRTSWRNSFNSTSEKGADSHHTASSSFRRTFASSRRIMLPPVDGSLKEEDGEVEEDGAGGGSKGRSGSPVGCSDLLFDDKAYEKEWREMQTWWFNPLTVPGPKARTLIALMFERVGLLDLFCPPKTFVSFLEAVHKGYLDNPYHNFAHAVDVCHTCYRFTSLCTGEKFLTHLDLYSLFIAALGHDIGHFGLNNGYLVGSRHELALLHNDVSPLENMHCSRLYSITRENGHDVFGGMAKDEYKQCRKIIIACILGTDMSQHFSQINKAGVFYDVHEQELSLMLSLGEDGEMPETASILKDENRLFIMELFLHAADVSNPIKPFTVCKEWAKLVLEEFFAQGDREKAEGLEVSPMCDRNTVNMPSLQMNFLEYVVGPLYVQVVKLFPPLDQLLDNLMDNQKEWASKREYELKKECKANNVEVAPEIEKLEKRLSNMAKTLRPPKLQTLSSL